MEVVDKSVLMLRVSLSWIIKYLKYNARPDWLATMFISENKDTDSLKKLLKKKHFIKLSNIKRSLVIVTNWLINLRPTVHSFYPLYSSMLGFRVFKANQSYTEGKKSKQGCEVTGIELGTSRTEGRTLTNCAILALYHNFTRPLCLYTVL